MRKILFLAFQFLILHVSATTYYVSTNGKPEGDGSKENPYNITTAVKKANPGDVIYLAGGTYSLSETVKISRNGTTSSPIKMQPEPDVRFWTSADNLASIVMPGEFNCQEIIGTLQDWILLKPVTMDFISMGETTTQ